MHRFTAMVGAFVLMAATAGVAGATGTLTGTVTHVDPQSNIVHFNDGRIVYLEPGAAFQVDGRTVTIGDLRPGMNVVVNGQQRGAAGQASTPATSPAGQRASIPGHPAVDASGTVARFDAQSNTITFQDGRMLKLGNQSSVWQQGQQTAIQPGQQIFVRNAQPIGYRSAWNQDSMSKHRMGTVLRVDPARALVILNDGTVVHLSQSTRMHGDGQQAMTLSQLSPGDEVVIVGAPRVAGSGGDTAGMASPRSASPATPPGAAAGAALPATQPGMSSGAGAQAGTLSPNFTASFDAFDIFLVRKHQAP